MPKKTDAYKTPDGKLFPTEEEALIHEFGVIVQNALEGSDIHESDIRALWENRLLLLNFLLETMPKSPPSPERKQ